MSLKIVGLSEINGPLVALDGIHGAGYEEMVELELQDGTTRTGRIVQMDGDRCIIQVSKVTAVSPCRTPLPPFWDIRGDEPLQELLGRVLNGSGRPIDGGRDLLGKEGGHQRQAAEPCFPYLSPELHQHRYFRHRHV